MSGHFYPDWLEESAFKSTGLTSERFQFLVAEGRMTRFELPKSIAYMVDMGDHINIIGYAGSRNDYAATAAKALELGGGMIPAMALIYPKMLDSIMLKVSVKVLGAAGQFSDKDKILIQIRAVK